MKQTHHQGSCDITELVVRVSTSPQLEAATRHAIVLRLWYLMVDTRCQLVERSEPHTILLSARGASAGEELVKICHRSCCECGVPPGMFFITKVELGLAEREAPYASTMALDDGWLPSYYRVDVIDRWGRARELCGGSWDELGWVSQDPAVRGWLDGPLGRVSRTIYEADAPPEIVELVFDEDPRLWGLVELPAKVLCPYERGTWARYTGALTLRNVGDAPIHGLRNGAERAPFTVPYRLNDDASGALVLPRREGDDDEAQLVFGASTLAPKAELRRSFEFRVEKIGRFGVRGACDFRFLPAYAVSIEGEGRGLELTRVEIGDFEVGTTRSRVMVPREQLLDVEISYVDRVHWPLEIRVGEQRSSISAEITVRPKRSARAERAIFESLELSYELAIDDDVGWNPEYTCAALDGHRQPLRTEYYVAYDALESDFDKQLDYTWTVDKDDPKADESGFVVKHRLSYFYAVDFTNDENYWATGDVGIEAQRPERASTTLAGGGRLK